MLLRLFSKVHPSWMIIMFSVGVLVGDILVHLFCYTVFGSKTFLALAICMLAFSLVVSRRVNLVLAFLAGIILVSFRAAPNFIAIKTFREAFDMGSDNSVIESASVSGRILKDPDVDKDKTALVLDELIVNGVGFSGKIYTTFSGGVGVDSELKRSDTVVLEGTLMPGFGTYLAYLYRPRVMRVERAGSGDLFLNLRDDFATRVKKHLPNKEAGLALGYLLGVRRGVSEEFEETLRIVGLTHILVASGTHLSILVSFARKLLRKFSRFFGFFGGVAFTLVFVGITGLTPSMSRAAPVALLGLMAWYFGRDRSPPRVFLIVMAGTLIFEPTNLFDLAWLLSFGSFGGIMVLSPIIKRALFSEEHPPGFFTELLITSVSATLVCAPILLYFFGSISLISILANLLILPTISAVMGLTFLVGILESGGLLFSGGFLGSLFQGGADLFGAITKILLDYHFFIVETLGKQEYFLIKMESENPLVFLLYILLIPLFVAEFRRRRKIRKSSI